MIKDTKIDQVIPEKINLDLESKFDLLMGTGIRLDQVDAYRKDEKTLNGLQSPFFGSDFGDENSFAERYSCKCGKYVGMMHKGQICEVCDTRVEYVDADLEKTGWIMLDDMNLKVLSPIFAAKLNDALGVVDGEKVLNKILEVGFTEEDNDKIFSEKELEDAKKHPFMKKGMVWLVENIETVLDHYSKRKPSKRKLFDEIRNDLDKVFTSSIPVFSSILRVELNGEKDKKLYKLRINTIYQSIINTFNKINSFGPYDQMEEEDRYAVNRFLYAANKDVQEIFTEIFKLLNSKKGFIMAKVISGRYNFCTRCIIIPDSGYLRSDECELCYLSCMELFRYEIINIYSKLYNCTLIEAEQEWKRGLVDFSPSMYNIMNHIVEEQGEYLNVIINRNPSINYLSFMTLRIVSVKPNINDKSLGINTRVLKTMGADFDGDMINVFRVIGKDFAKRFGKNMNPRYNLYVDRVNGRINRDMMISKDEATGFYLFNNI